MSELLLAALLLAGLPGPPDPADPCAGQGTALYVDATHRALWLCEAGKATASMPVALGRGGVGKRAEGDAKVPLGVYTLGAPHRSESFHLFIPVGYPTPAQRRHGYTGSAIGVHGPPRAYQGPMSTDIDWTLGCIAVGSDDEIGRVAAWLAATRTRRIVIAE